MENKAIAAKADSAFSAIVIYDVIDGEKVVFSYEWEGLEGLQKTRKTTAKIRYTAKDRAYFIGRGCRQYLDDFMRI